MKAFALYSGVFCALVLLCGCVSSPGGRPDPLSAGSAKMILKKGETRGMEVLEAFGGPNLVEGDADGREMWLYNRMSFVTASKDVGGVAGGGGAGPAGGGGGLIWGHASITTASSKSMNLFLYFEDSLLVDYRYRSTTY